jgi:hypothetical protein
MSVLPIGINPWPGSWTKEQAKKLRPSTPRTKSKMLQENERSDPDLNIPSCRMKY